MVSILGTVGILALSYTHVRFYCLLVVLCICMTHESVKTPLCVNKTIYVYYSDTVSMDAFIIAMLLRFSMAAHRHDRRGIYRCLLLRFRGKIEIDHSYTVCAVVVCAATPGTALVGPAGAAASRPAPLVLCREWQHKPLQRRPYRG